MKSSLVLVMSHTNSGINAAGICTIKARSIVPCYSVYPGRVIRYNFSSPLLVKRCRFRQVSLAVRPVFGTTLTSQPTCTPRIGNHLGSGGFVKNYEGFVILSTRLRTCPEGKDSDTRQLANVASDRRRLKVCLIVQ